MILGGGMVGLSIAHQIKETRPDLSILIIDKEINTGTDIVHVGSGKNHSVLDIVSALEESWGKKINKKFVKMRPGEHKIEINLDL